MKKNDSKYIPTTPHNPCPTRDYCKRLQKSFNEAQSELVDRRQRIAELKRRMEIMRNAITSQLEDEAYKEIDSWFDENGKVLEDK